MQSITTPVTAGQIIEIKITGLGSGGEGVGKYENFTVFIKGALSQELVRAEIKLVKKNYATAHLLEILEASPERTEPSCPVYETCGGCQLQHLSYEGQLEIKRLQVEDALRRIGHLQTEVLPVLGADNPWYYRNKMQFPAAETKGEISIGCYAAASHKVVDTKECLIQKEANNEVLKAVRQWMIKYCISAYNEKTNKGLVRHVMSRVGVQSGEVMVVLVTSEYEVPYRKELLAILQKNIPGLVSVVQNINKKKMNIIMSERNRVMWGKTNIIDSLGKLHFNISANSFFQVNSEQAAKLYNKVLEYACLTGKETVADIYCGTGTIALYIARHAQKVYGIEIVAPAIEDANLNATENNCTNAEFFCGDAAQTLPKLLREGVSPDVIVVDPPRAGCDERVLNAIAEVGPQRIVYVSCNPASLARDLNYLEQHGYRTMAVQPVDMFPMTSHVECVVLMTRHKP